jgi:glycosyltransferase involved in cell wall biosynthesis
VSTPRIRPGVTAVIPSIPTRTHTYLHRALDSVLQQDRPVEAISVRIDHERAGAARNRTRACTAVNTEWTALLDDDDEWYPDHIRLLMEHAEETGADLVYPWFTVPNGFDPWPEREGQPFDEMLLRTMNYIPITVLVRSELIWEAGGFTPKGPADNPCEDWGTWERMLAAGAKFSHLNRRTWVWHWHGGNTSGRPDKW